VKGYLREGGAGRERLRDFVARLFVHQRYRNVFNPLYERLGWKALHRFYLLFAKIYLNGNYPGFEDGTWSVRFQGRRLLIPLRRRESWLDWDTALSILGHDQEVKQTYDGLLNSPAAPEAFLDIGANYGTHSVLMLVAGVPTVAVEPNPACVEQIRELAACNQVEPLIENCALADSDGHVTLDFPPQQTWLGSIRLGEAGETVEDRPGWTSLQVPLHTVDGLAGRIPPGRLLIKIDAEGAEPAILRGARNLIAERRPMIIFECWEDPEARRKLQAEFPDSYAIYPLPWSPSRPGRAIAPTGFTHAAGTNFIAVPN
jgi:FkbM family methyltransferase